MINILFFDPSRRELGKVISEEASKSNCCQVLDVSSQSSWGFAPDVVIAHSSDLFGEYSNTAYRVKKAVFDGLEKNPKLIVILHSGGHKNLVEQDEKFPRKFFVKPNVIKGLAFHLGELADLQMKEGDIFEFLQRIWQETNKVSAMSAAKPILFLNDRLESYFFRGNKSAFENLSDEEKGWARNIWQIVSIICLGVTGSGCSPEDQKKIFSLLRRIEESEVAIPLYNYMKGKIAFPDFSEVLDSLGKDWAKNFNEELIKPIVEKLGFAALLKSMD